VLRRGKGWSEGLEDIMKARLICSDEMISEALVAYINDTILSQSGFYAIGASRSGDGYSSEWWEVKIEDSDNESQDKQ